MSCFLKNHSDAGKKSNFWDKENVWALKRYTTNLLYGRSRLRAKSVTRFIDMRPVYCSDKLKNVLRVSCVGEEKAMVERTGRPPDETLDTYLVFGLIAKLTLNCGLQVKKYEFPNLQKLASIWGEIGENTPNT